MGVVELSMDEIEMIEGGIYSARMALVGLAAGIVGTGLMIAGMGTPISIAGGALAVEGAAAFGVGIAG